MEPPTLRTPQVCTYKELVEALERIQKDYEKDEVIQAVFPRLIINITRHTEDHNPPFLTGDEVYFNMNLALTRKSVIKKVFYPQAALRYLSKGLFGGKDQRYGHARRILEERGLAGLAKDVASSYHK